MPEIPYGGIRGNDASDEHLWKHGVFYGDADDVWEGPAKYFDQDAEYVTDDEGRLRLRPDRVVMIGPDAGGRFLTIILESPDLLAVSHVVTGWSSTQAERTRYDQPGGRMRRQ